MDKSFQEKNITDYKHSPAKRLATKIKRKRDTLTKPIESSSNIVTEVAIKYERKYQCPYCDERKEKLKLISHIEKKHPECIPEGYTPTRIVFNIINKKEKGKCTICGKESPWNEDKGRYDRFCSDKCKKQYEALAAERLKRVRGMTKQEMLKDPEYQNNVMLANRGISGKYKFQDGTIRTYVGSYERKFLEFMDTFLNVKSEDLETPGPIIEYKYKGETHKWITDAYYAPYNLVFDIKDGGDNPNNRNMPEYRAKQDAKEAAIKKQGKYNYIRLTDNKFEQLIELMMELKELYIENNGEYTPIVRINESVEEDGELLDESYIIDEIYDEEDDTMLNEGFIFNKKNLYINYNNFKSGKSNILLVTGLSGSGKTTLGSKLASENNAELIELDLFEKCYMFDKMEQLKEAGLPFYEYLIRNKDIMEKLKSKSIRGKELGIEIEKFLKWCISFCKKDKKNRYVLEGVQIYSFLNKESLGNTPIVFVNTSVLTSIFRRYKRSYKYDKNDFKNELSELPQCIAWYIDNEKAYRDFKKAVLKEYIVNESTSTLDPNHKTKKTNKKFKYMDLKDPDIDKYLNQDSYCKKFWDYIHNNTIGEIIIDVEEDGESLDESYIIDEIYDEEDDTMNENYLFNKKDIYYNKDKFDSGEINLCFITGHSGSGKSTMGHNMENKSNIECYEMDDVRANWNFSNDNLKEYGNLIYSFFNGPGKKYKYDSKQDWINDKKWDNKDEYKDGYEICIMRDFVDYAIKYAESHKDKKFIIEGVYIYHFFEPKELENYAVYIKGTSMLISKIRAAKRDANNKKGLLNKVKRFAKQSFLDKSYWKHYLLGEDKVMKFYNYYSSKINNESTILNDKGYYKLLDKYKDAKYCGWDEEQTYSTIDLCIKSEECYGKDMYCYSLDPDTYKITYIGKLHVSEFEDDGYSIEWLDKVNEATIIKPSISKPSQEGFMGRGSWNPIKRVNGEPYRERVECVIFNKQLNKVLISVDQKGVRIPGGGTMKDKSLESQVIKECQEEVRINIDNIKYIGEYYLSNKEQNIEDDVYKGKYTYAYLATYDSDYEGYIRPEDESSMIKYIKWYDIYEAKSLLKQYNPDIYILFCNEYKEYIENLRLL